MLQCRKLIYTRFEIALCSYDVNSLGRQPRLPAQTAHENGEQFGQALYFFACPNCSHVNSLGSEQFGALQTTRGLRQQIL